MVEFFNILVDLGILVFWLSISWMIAFALSPYDPTHKNKKYISINNQRLQKVLIQRGSGKYVKVENRKKLAITSFVIYVLAVVILITAIVLQFVPEMPCKPFEIPLSKRGGYTVYTYNTGIPLALACILTFSQIIMIMAKTTLRMYKRKEDTDRLNGWQWVLWLLVLLGAIGLIVYLALQVIGF